MKKICSQFFIFFIIPLGVAIALNALALKLQKIRKKQLSKNGHIAKKHHPASEKPFAIIVPSFNNEDYCIQNLDSILNQQYSNFHIIYINDASNDNTLGKIKKYLQNHPQKQKIKIISNSKNKGALKNIYDAVHSLQNHEIVVICDGDDWLAHPNVLATLNQYYANEMVWLTWGNYVDFPYSKGGESWPITKDMLQKGQFRKNPWYFSHLKTFYAALFKKIKNHDLMQNGTFFSTCYDLAIMFPMLEMARDHAYFTKDIFYIYNRQSPLNDDKIHANTQKKTDKFIRSKTIYSPLKSINF